MTSLPRCPTCQSTLVVGGALCAVCLLRSAVDETDVESEAPGLASDWRMVSVIDAHARAMVYLVERADDQREARIAHLHLSGARTSMPDAAARLGRERRRLLALRHRGLVPVIDAGLTDAGQVFVVFEHLQGRRLGEFLAARPRGQEEVDHVFRDLSAALDHAHAAGLAHGAISASNVVVTGTRLERRASLLALGVNYLFAHAGLGSMPTPADDRSAWAELREGARAGVR